MLEGWPFKSLQIQWQALPSDKVAAKLGISATARNGQARHLDGQ